MHFNILIYAFPKSYAQTSIHYIKATMSFSLVYFWETPIIFLEYTYYHVMGIHEKI